MKNYRKLLNQATADAISHSIEAIRHLDDKTDKILVWLVGLGTATIALLIGYAEKIHLTASSLFYSITALLFCILCGVLSRILSNLHMTLSLQIFTRAKVIALGPLSNISPRELTGIEDVQQISKYFLTDLDLEYETVLKQNASWQDKMSDDEYSRVLYKSYSKFILEEFEFARTSTQKFLSNTIGRSFPDEPQKKQLSKARRKWITKSVLANTSFILFVASTMSYVAGITIVAVDYLKDFL